MTERERILQELVLAEARTRELQHRLEKADEEEEQVYSEEYLEESPLTYAGKNLRKYELARADSKNRPATPVQVLEQRLSFSAKLKPKAKDQKPIFDF